METKHFFIKPFLVSQMKAIWDIRNFLILLMLASVRQLVQCHRFLLKYSIKKISKIKYSFIRSPIWFSQTWLKTSTENTCKFYFMILYWPNWDQVIQNDWQLNSCDWIQDPLIFHSWFFFFKPALSKNSSNIFSEVQEFQNKGIH